MKHLEKVFEILKQHQFVVNKEKCTLAATKIEYLGHYISAKWVYIDPRKIEIIVGWPSPKIVKQLRSFLGMTRNYRRFVKGYGGIARPLTNLLKKGSFAWTQEVKDAFN